MFYWFDAKRAEEFGVSLAVLLSQKIPFNNKLNESKLSSKTEYVLAKMSAQIKAFKQKEPLNVYKKAKLGSAFKWSLKDAGYSDVYIETLMKWLVLHL